MIGSIGSIGANSDPVSGIAQVPNMGCQIRDTFPMEKEEARLTLAANLVSLMGARPHLDKFEKIVAKGGPSNGTLDRIRRHESACSLDQLDKLAKVYELEPWQLLVPNLNPNSLPVLLGGEVEKSLWARIDQLRMENQDLRQRVERLGTTASQPSAGIEKKAKIGLVHSSGKPSGKPPPKRPTGKRINLGEVSAGGPHKRKKGEA
jgi:hypothetical protein